jgi:hypothetical protein
VGELRNRYDDLDRKPEREKQFGRPSHRWGNNIKMGIKEI